MSEEVKSQKPRVVVLVAQAMNGHGHDSLDTAAIFELRRTAALEPNFFKPLEKEIPDVKKAQPLALQAVDSVILARNEGAKLTAEALAGRKIDPVVDVLFNSHEHGTKKGPEANSLRPLLDIHPEAAVTLVVAPANTIVRMVRESLPDVEAQQALGGHKGYGLPGGRAVILKQESNEFTLLASTVPARHTTLSDAERVRLDRDQNIAPVTPSPAPVVHQPAQAKPATGGVASVVPRGAVTAPKAAGKPNGISQFN